MAGLVVAKRCLRSLVLPNCQRFLGRVSVASAPPRNFSNRSFSTTRLLQDRKFTAKHEYIDIKGNIGTVGITDFAQKELGDVVFVELPAVGTQFEKDAVLCTMESVKAVAEVYTPLAGTVRESNGELQKRPGLVNSSPYEEGWLVKMDLTEKDLQASAALMDAAAYDKYLHEH